jgi:predicted metal-dependent enzyme (double-stranded beta helix superfamily)
MLRSRLFIVRIWWQQSRRRAPRFRAVVRAVDAERGQVFRRPDDIGRYLKRRIEEPTDMDASTYSLDRFVAELRAARAQGGAETELITRVRAVARRAADRHAAWLCDAMCEPDATQGFGFHLVHEEPAHELAVFVASWLPGRGTPPHDHGTWAVVVGLKGCERNTRWRRTDDGTRADHAAIVVEDERMIGAGDIVSLRSGEIHSVRNEGVGVSVSLHVYGRHVNHTARSQFDPVAGRASPYRVVTRGACEAGAIAAEGAR